MVLKHRIGKGNILMKKKKNCNTNLYLKHEYTKHLNELVFKRNIGIASMRLFRHSLLV